MKALRKLVFVLLFSLISCAAQTDGAPDIIEEVTFELPKNQSLTLINEHMDICWDTMKIFESMYDENSESENIVVFLTSFKEIDFSLLDEKFIAKEKEFFALKDKYLAQQKELKEKCHKEYVAAWKNYLIRKKRLKGKVTRGLAAKKEECIALLNKNIEQQEELKEKCRKEYDAAFKNYLFEQEKTRKEYQVKREIYFTNCQTPETKFSEVKETIIPYEYKTLEDESIADVLGADIIAKLIENRGNSRHTTVLNLKNHLTSLKNDPKRIIQIIWLIDYLDISLYKEALKEFLLENIEIFEEIVEELPGAGQAFGAQLDLKKFIISNNFFAFKKFQETESNEIVKKRVLNLITKLDFRLTADVELNGLLEGVKNLKELNLWNCGITEFNLPQSVKETIEILILTDNEHINLGDSLKGMKNLKKLGLTRCGLDEINFSQEVEETLEMLLLSNNVFIDLDCLKNMKKLKILSVMGCQLSDLDDLSTDVLLNLEELNISFNDELSFGDMIRLCDSKKLKKLHVAGCNLSDEDIFDLKILLNDPEFEGHDPDKHSCQVFY